jgi:hypothetical protein
LNSRSQHLDARGLRCSNVILSSNEQVEVALWGHRLEFCSQIIVNRELSLIHSSSPIGLDPHHVVALGRSQIGGLREVSYRKLNLRISIAIPSHFHLAGGRRHGRRRSQVILSSSATASEKQNAR